ncbi:MAG: hypothetical protein ACRCSP_05585 [Rhodoglobus sp.]
MVGSTRFSELVMEEAIRRITGATVTHGDDGSENRMVDAYITRPDGTCAALEVTTLADPQALEMLKHDSPFAVESSHSWVLEYPGPSLSRKSAQRHVPKLVQWLDERDIVNPDDSAEKLPDTEEWQWYSREDEICLHRNPASKAGLVAMQLKPVAGWAQDEYPDMLAEWVEDLQKQQWWIENTQKLQVSGCEALHLAVPLHYSSVHLTDGGVPFSIMSTLFSPQRVDSRGPTGMEPLTDLWLLFGTTMVHWARGVGWSLHTQQDDDTWAEVGES